MKMLFSARYKRKSLSLHTTNDYRYRMLIGRKAEPFRLSYPSTLTKITAVLLLRLHQYAVRSTAVLSTEYWRTLTEVLSQGWSAEKIPLR